ncbi:hypothetical protein [Streptosporangium sp. NPDC051022]|uniref:hypothetical protein n=1 Tax=Streptosporangium sp. NPDC051022 TaxID=3155752 RepID=UPI003430D01D
MNETTQEAETSSELLEALVRPAAELRNGYGLLFVQDRYNAFQFTPLQGERWKEPQPSSDLMWARVADLEPLPGGQHWWRPPVHPIALYCEFAAGGSIATIVLSDALVVMRPRRLPRRMGRLTP